MLSLFILIGFLLITLIFGRIYCSYFCPLGTCQDTLIRILGNIRKKRDFKYNPPLGKLKITILILAILSLISGSLYFIGWLDPFSIFGKGVTYILKPLVAFVNNGVDLILRMFNIYLLSRMEYTKIHLLNLIPFGLILVLILFFTVIRGRLYCNSVCPLGTLLGLISTRSLLCIKIEHEKCTSCGLCEKVCKAECIDSDRKIVYESSCIRCFNCLSACPLSAIAYIPFYK